MQTLVEEKRLHLFLDDALTNQDFSLVTAGVWQGWWSSSAEGAYLFFDNLCLVLSLTDSVMQPWRFW